MSKKPKSDTFDAYDWELPSWIVDESLDRTTPYTEEELDLLVEGTLEGIRDMASWKNLVARQARWGFVLLSQQPTIRPEMAVGFRSSDRGRKP